MKRKFTSLAMIKVPSMLLVLASALILAISWHAAGIIKEIANLNSAGRITSQGILEMNQPGDPAGTV